jgi:hypothetical protein
VVELAPTSANYLACLYNEGVIEQSIAYDMYVLPYFQVVSIVGGIVNIFFGGLAAGLLGFLFW